MNHISRSAVLSALLVLSISPRTIAQKAKEKKNKPPPAPFSWVSPAPEGWLKRKALPATVQHATFRSPSMGVDVGFYIYLPKEYSAPENAAKRYPVVYHLHGGRPGAEYKSIGLSAFVDKAIEDGDIRPAIYVFPNGGPMSWYNYPSKQNGLGEDVFVKELIPHVDRTWRTRGGEARGIEGFSQGGRGTTRIVFKYPALFSSAAPGGSGYEPEQRIRDNDGYESAAVRFLPLGYNAWDLAKAYAARKDRPAVPIALWVGTKGFNYEFNGRYSAYLTRLEIPHQMFTAKDVGHSASGCYAQRGVELMQFHQRAIGRAD